MGGARGVLVRRLHIRVRSRDGHHSAGFRAGLAAHIAYVLTGERLERHRSLRLWTGRVVAVGQLWDPDRARFEDIPSA